MTINKLFENLKKWYFTKVLRKKYYRTGHCLGCGECCKQIYVRHGNNVIKDKEVFEKLKKMHAFYTYLEVMDSDEIGLVFRCKNLDEETHLCKIHNRRPGICRRYPQEAIFMMGGGLSDKCGYKLEPIIPFDEVFNKVKKCKQDKK